MKCFIKDCPNMGEHRFTIKLWAQGYAKKSHDPAVLKPDLKLCPKCKNEYTLDKILEDFFPPQNRQALQASLKAAGRAPFNWGSAEVEWT